MHDDISFLATCLINNFFNLIFENEVKARAATEITPVTTFRAKQLHLLMMPLIAIWSIVSAYGIVCMLVIIISVRVICEWEVSKHKSYNKKWHTNFEFEFWISLFQENVQLQLEFSSMRNCRIQYDVMVKPQDGATSLILKHTVIIQTLYQGSIRKKTWNESIRKEMLF